MTAGDLIARACRLLGVHQAGETPPVEDLDTGLDALNDLVSAWALHRQILYTVLRTVKTLASGTASYTIGAGGSINIERPMWIDEARLILDTAVTPTATVHIRVFTEQEWQAIPQQSLAGSPIAGIYYDHNWAAGLGKIYPWPVPDVGTTQLVLYTPTGSPATFADLSTDYTFPPGVARALRFNLALELAPEFDASPSAYVERVARESLADVQRGNFRETYLGMDSALVGGGWSYNIRTDE